MNEADSRHLSSQLESLGYQPTTQSNEADIVVLNTCVVRQQAENKALGRLGSLRSSKAQRPHMTIGLMGCMVGVKEAPRLKKEFPYVDVFMPPSDTEPLLDFIAERGLHSTDKIAENREKAIRDAIQNEEYLLPKAQKGHTVTAHVPVVLGCSHACTFCIIPYRRGIERSRPKEEIILEAQRLVDQGIREIMLLGQIVDRYGVDFEEPYDLADLMKELVQIKRLSRLRFLTSHPNWMTDKLIHTVASENKICPQFEIPIQAGNKEVLERMRRGYTPQAYLEVIDRIRAILPDAAIHTDIIVGFPGETKEQFMDTYRIIKEVEFDKVHIAKYSERPKTIASRTMPDTVSDEEKEQRRLILDELQSSILTLKNKTLLSQTVEILVESKDKKTGRWRGRTPQSKLVYVDDATELYGKLVNVKIDWTGPYSMLGQLCTAEPTPLATASI